MSSPVQALTGQLCTFCKQKTLTLTESEEDIPYFGKVFLFSMTCTNCKYHKADVECAEHHEPTKYSLDVENTDDLNIRIVRSADGLVKIPHVGTIEPGESSNGYVTNVEGIINRIKQQIESFRDSEEDLDVKKKCKNMLKKLQKVIWGQEKIRIIIEDPSGNSAIISDKAIKSPLKS